MLNKSSQKAKVYFITAQILFWYSFICGITFPLAPFKQKVNLFTYLSEFSGAMTLNPLAYVSLFLFWRSYKNLSDEELRKRKFWSKYFPKPVVIIFGLGVVISLFLLLPPFLIRKSGL